MKVAEEASGSVMAAWLAGAIGPKLSPIQSVVKKRASRAVETLDAVLEAAEKAPARLVAATMAGILAFSIGSIELVIKLFG
jgi:hypothetical protein